MTDSSKMEADYRQSLIWRIYDCSNYVYCDNIEDGGDMLLPVELLPCDENVLVALMVEMGRAYDIYRFQNQLNQDYPPHFYEIEFHHNNIQVTVEAHFDECECSLLGIHIWKEKDGFLVLQKSVFAGYDSKGDMKAYWLDQSKSVNDALKYDARYDNPFISLLVMELIEALQEALP